MKKKLKNSKSSKIDYLKIIVIILSIIIIIYGFIVSSQGIISALNSKTKDAYSQLTNIFLLFASYSLMIRYLVIVGVLWIFSQLSSTSLKKRKTKN